VNIAVMALVAFAFGYIVGMGLPPAPTYIIVAVVIAPFMIAADINPWVVHYFAFLIAVFGELSPPTSLTAAVTSRIADASFVRTMLRALELCMPLLVLMIGVFAWPQVIVEPGLPQVVPALMLLAVTIGLTIGIHGWYSQARPVNLGAKLATAAASVTLLFRPPMTIAFVLATAIATAVVIGWWRTRQLADKGADMETSTA
jgi:TRAP-type uncharacterized transport system fused permease subunit